MKKTALIFALIILCVFSACTPSELHLFEKAESFSDTNRDSLAYYLRLIKHPEKLPAAQKAKFGIMKFSYYPVNKENKSLLEYSFNYYTQRHDTTMLIKYYVNKSLYNNNNSSQKIEFLTMAKDLALKTNDRIQTCNLYLNIGYVYENQDNLDMAYHNFLQALEYANKDDFSFSVAHWSLSRLYRKQKKVDKAIESLLIVIEYDTKYSPQRLSSAYKQLSDIYLNLKDYKAALNYINLSINYRTHRKEASTYNLAKAIIFINTQQLDSARLYLNYAIESPNTYVSTAALGYLYQLNNKINLFEKAYYTKIKEDESFRSLRWHEENNILQEKYEEERLKNENSQLKIEKQKEENYSLFISIVLLFVCASICILYLYKQKQQALAKHKHEEDLLKEKTLLHEAQNRLLKQENELALLHEKAATLRASLFKKMSLSPKLPSLGIEETKRVSGKISLTQQDITELKRTVDAAYNDFSKRLVNLYSALSADDITFCCLIKIQVDMQDLSDIYCISKAGITKRKMRLKKDKLKITSEISLDVFIQDL